MSVVEPSDSDGPPQVSAEGVVRHITPVGDPRSSLDLLLVEPDDAAAQQVRARLESAASGRVRIESVTGLEQARLHLATGPVDCVLLDLWLPDSSGLDTLTNLVADHPNIPIVILSDQGDEATVMAAVREGAQDFLSKDSSDGALLWRTVRYAMERKHTELAYRFQASHDPLTGLANRQGFMDRLELAIARLSREPGYVALLFLDLDGFKRVNDTVGHAYGDDLLIAFSRRLEQEVRAPDLVGRLGGDEFLVLLEGVPSEFAALGLAGRIHRLLEAPFTVGDAEVVLSASIGLALSLDPDTLGRDLIRQADAAMYRAKLHGRAQSELYDEGMQLRVASRLQLRADLQHALTNDELRVRFQPVVDLATRTTIGAEAFVAWHRVPGTPALRQGEFLEAAEETGLIVPICELIFEGACRELVVLAGGDYDPPDLLALSVSGRQFGSASFLACIEAAMAETGVDPSRLAIQVTEAGLLFDETLSDERVHYLKSLGIRIVLDGFGAGSSSVTLLQRFPIDVLKLDASLMSRMGAGDTLAADLVAGILTLSKSLGIEVVASGVASDEQADWLLAHGCRLGQGQYLAASSLELTRTRSSHGSSPSDPTVG